MQLNSSVNSNGCVSWGSTNEGGGGAAARISGTRLQKAPTGAVTNKACLVMHPGAVSAGVRSLLTPAACEAGSVLGGLSAAPL
jgi:hypothetical protein